MVGSRIVLIPVLAMIGYELLRFGARHRSNPLIRVVMWPGILVQMITTKQPTDDMIEVAIVSIEEALRADGEVIPEGGLGLTRDPMPQPGETAAAVREAQAAADVAVADGAGAAAGAPADHVRVRVPAPIAVEVAAPLDPPAAG